MSPHVERDALRTLAQKMPPNSESCRQIIDPNHVIARTPRRQKNIEIKQHDRDAGVFEVGDRLLVRPRSIRDKFEGMEKHARHMFLREPIGKATGFPRANGGLLALDFALYQIPARLFDHPRQAGYDRLEDFRIALARNDKPESPGRVECVTRHH